MMVLDGTNQVKQTAARLECLTYTDLTTLHTYHTQFQNENIEDIFLQAQQKVRIEWHAKSMKERPEKAKVAEKKKNNKSDSTSLQSSLPPPSNRAGLPRLLVIALVIFGMVALYSIAIGFWKNRHVTNL